uniref:Uncharacterized protein n=1 Tax=Arundo donax TaxID=35708 RepID=A0A0A8Y7R8_ARUDO
MSRCTRPAPMSKPLALKKSGPSAVAPPTAKLAPHAKSSALRPPQYGRTNGNPSVSAMKSRMRQPLEKRPVARRKKVSP